MYCENCHRENPDNFDTCIHCGTPLYPVKKTRNPESRFFPLLKVTPLKLVTALLVIAITAAVISGVVLVAGREHPEKVADKYALCIENNDAELYASLLCPEYKTFMIDYYYYSRQAMLTALGDELKALEEFYTQKCGEGFSVNCEIDNVIYYGEDTVDAVNGYLEQTCGFTSPVTDVAGMRTSLSVKGTSGEYLTVLDNFICIKQNGEWYRASELPVSLLEEKND